MASGAGTDRGLTLIALVLPFPSHAPGHLTVVSADALHREKASPPPGQLAAPSARSTTPRRSAEDLPLVFSLRGARRGQPCQGLRRVRAGAVHPAATRPRVGCCSGAVESDQPARRAPGTSRAARRAERDRKPPAGAATKERSMPDCEEKEPVCSLRRPLSRLRGKADAAPLPPRPRPCFYAPPAVGGAGTSCFATLLYLFLPQGFHGQGAGAPSPGRNVRDHLVCPAHRTPRGGPGAGGSRPDEALGAPGRGFPAAEAIVAIGRASLSL